MNPGKLKSEFSFGLSGFLRLACLRYFRGLAAEKHGKSKEKGRGF
jgi:hypothetical protein